MRLAPAVLIGAFLMTTLAACGGDDAPTAASATTTAPAATTAAAEPAGAAAPGDKALCESANKADKAMKAELIKALQESKGEMPNAEMSKVLGGLADQLSTAAAGSDSPVGTAIKDFAALATKAAKAADPVTAADDPALEKSGKDLTAACKAAGVKVNY